MKVAQDKCQMNGAYFLSLFPLPAISTVAMFKVLSSYITIEHFINLERKIPKGGKCITALIYSGCLESSSLLQNANFHDNLNHV